MFYNGRIILTSERCHIPISIENMTRKRNQTIGLISHGLCHVFARAERVLIIILRSLPQKPIFCAPLRSNIFHKSNKEETATAAVSAFKN